jgi:hypothetical protein
LIRELDEIGALEEELLHAAAIATIEALEVLVVAPDRSALCRRALS